jgi:hypothetical protein
MASPAGPPGSGMDRKFPRSILKNAAERVLRDRAVWNSPSLNLPFYDGVSSSVFCDLVFCAFLHQSRIPGAHGKNA